MNFRKNIFFHFEPIKSFMSKTKRKSGTKNYMSRIKKAETVYIVSSGIKGSMSLEFFGIVHVYVV